MLTSNPASRAKRPRREQAPAVAMWNAEHLASFLKTTGSHRLHAYFRLAAYTGARRGELMNLLWSDVNLGVDSSIRLRGNVSVIDGVRVEGTTKGGRERTVSIDPGTASVFAECPAPTSWSTSSESSPGLTGPGHRRRLVHSRWW